MTTAKQTKVKTRPVTSKVEIIRHVDGRMWVRRNGCIVYEQTVSVLSPELCLQIARKIYRQFGSTIATTLAYLTTAAEIWVSHPNFVKPYES